MNKNILIYVVLSAAFYYFVWMKKDKKTVSSEVDSGILPEPDTTDITSVNEQKTLDTENETTPNERAFVPQPEKKPAITISEPLVKTTQIEQVNPVSEVVDTEPVLPMESAEQALTIDEMNAINAERDRNRQSSYSRDKQDYEDEQLGRQSAYVGSSRKLLPHEQTRIQPSLGRDMSRKIPKTGRSLMA